LVSLRGSISGAESDEKQTENNETNFLHKYFLIHKFQIFLPRFAVKN
jgi:hypothetical protein